MGLLSLDTLFFFLTSYFNKSSFFLCLCWEDIWLNRLELSTKGSSWHTCFGDPLSLGAKIVTKNKLNRQPL